MCIQAYLSETYKFGESLLSANTFLSDIPLGQCRLAHNSGQIQAQHLEEQWALTRWIVGTSLTKFPRNPSHRFGFATLPYIDQCRSLGEPVLID